MRRLIRVVNHPRDERGISAVFMGLAITVMVAALGLSVDIGNVAYQRSKAQHAADSAARQVAVACAKAPSGTECISAQATATAAAGLTFEDGTVTASVSAPQVGVSVSKTIDTPLLSLIGIASKDVEARAQASWNGGHPTEGYPVLPLGVSYCTWKNNSSLAGTANEADAKIALRTDTLQSVHNLVSSLTGGLLSILPIDALLNSLLGSDAAEQCVHPEQGQLLTLTGAVWLTGEHVITGTLSGLFGWNADLCRLNVNSDLSTFLGGVGGAAFIPPGCTQKFGPGRDVMVGKTILLPVYVPSSNLQNAGFRLLSVCAGLPLLSSSKGKTCVEVPPKIGASVVGFAPFKVTGWTYPGTPGGYTDSTVGCSTKTIGLNLFTVINGLLTVVERLVNAVVLGLLQVLGIGGNMTASLACNGLQGYFTKSFTKDPNFQYGTGGADFGASAVRLIQ